MRGMRILLALMIAAVILTGTYENACAGGWPLSATAEVLCDYADTYRTASGTAATHTGVDIAASPGDSVLVLEDGTVTFAGAIPADGGGTVLAATVESADGKRWSYLPLESLGVAEGEFIACGETLGHLAAAGDDSSEATHVHVGVRVGERYVDPTSFLVAPHAPEPLPESSMVESTEVVPEPPTRSLLVEPGEVAQIAGAAPVVSPIAHSVAGQPVVRPQTVQMPAAAAGAEFLPVVGEEASRILVDGWMSRRVSHATPAVGESGGAIAMRYTAPSSQLKLALAAACLLAVGSAFAITRLRRRVTASGDTVAAAVGR